MARIISPEETAMGVVYCVELVVGTVLSVV
jgi:hypothetical protein